MNNTLCRTAALLAALCANALGTPVRASADAPTVPVVTNPATSPSVALATDKGEAPESPYAVAARRRAASAANATNATNAISATPESPLTMRRTHHLPGHSHQSGGARLW